MNSDLDPNKYHILTKKRKLGLTLLGAIIIFIILPIFGLVYYKFAVFRPSQKTDETVLEITGGEGVAQIGDKLFKADVINSEFLFKLYVTANKLGGNLQAGVYTIPGGANMVEVTDLLMHGTNDQVVTFIEGWRVEEIANLARKEFNKIDYAEFIKLAKNEEGYLFPDTYSLSVNTTEEELIRTMKDNFKSKTNELLSRENLEKAGLSREEAIIFASILEREIHNPEDMPIVAGILIKRWRNGELIGADATTQYAIAAHRYGCPYEGDQKILVAEDVCPDAENILDIEWWPHDLTVEELELKNQYNTRALVGLPPAPISNPGISSIEAVINHQNSDYNYYLSDKNGITRFARTLEEHNINVFQYLY